MVATLLGHSHLLYADDVTRLGTDNYTLETDPDTTGQSERVIISDPIDARRVLRQHPGKPAFPYQSIFIGSGLIGQTDLSLWRRQRRWMRPVFHFQEVRRHYPKVCNEARAMVMRLHEDSPSPSPIRTNVHAELLKTTFRMLGRVILNEHQTSTRRWFDDAKSEELRQAFEDGLQPFYQTTPQGRTAHATLQEFATHVLQTGGTTSEAPVGDDVDATPDATPTFTSRLLESGDASPYSSRQLQVDELLTTAYAGHETTANTIAWCFYELARHPRQQAQLREAIRSACQRSGVVSPLQLSYAQLSAIDLLTGAVRETLRLWPVVANGPFRVTGDAGDAALGLAPGTAFQTPHWVMHRNPAQWGSDASEFDMTRPLERGRWCEKAFMPFSVPPRDCVGRHVAMMEMRVLVATMVHHFRWDDRDPSDANNVSLHKRGRNWATLAPEDGLVVALHPVARAQEASRL